MRKSSLLCLMLLCLALPARAAEDAATREFNTQMNLALKGNADDQYRLGEMYELGRGTRPDAAMAYLWFNKAAMQGNARARDKIANWDKNKAETVEEQTRVNAAMRALQQQADHEAARHREKEKSTAEARAHQQADQDAAKQRERAAAEAAAAAKAKAAAPVESPKPATAAATKPEAVSATRQPKPATAAKPATKGSEAENAEFSANPCKGPQAKFLSTCN